MCKAPWYENNVMCTKGTHIIMVYTLNMNEYIIGQFTQRVFPRGSTIDQIENVFKICEMFQVLFK